MRESTTGGPVGSKRGSVNADWAGTYSINDKLRILDFFRYDNWRIPGQWNTLTTTGFGAVVPVADQAAVKGLLLPIGVFNSTSCTAALNYNQIGCPRTHRKLCCRSDQ